MVAFVENGNLTASESGMTLECIDGIQPLPYARIVGIEGSLQSACLGVQRQSSLIDRICRRIRSGRRSVGFLIAFKVVTAV